MAPINEKLYFVIESSAIYLYCNGIWYNTSIAYTHPSYTARNNGLYKITVDDTGHIFSASAVTKDDITSLGIPAQDTTYSVATESSNGLMSYSDKKIVNAISGSTYLGSMNGKTISDLRSSLDTWLSNNINVANASTSFTANPIWITYWNNNDTTSTISDGVRYTVSVIGTYTTKSYVQLRISTYADKTVFYVTRSNENWLHVYQIAFLTDNVASATKLKTARTISLTGDVTGSATFDGSSDASITTTVGDNSHIHNETTVTGIYDRNINWSSHISSGLSPLDIATSALHSTNKICFGNPDGVTVEYSTNGGSSWTSYSPTNAQKIALISNIGTNFTIGKKTSNITVNDKLRITLNASNLGVYISISKILINITTGGASGCTVKVETAPCNAQTSFTTRGTYAIAGWSGWNSIPCGITYGSYSADSTNPGVIRLTFSIGALSTTGYASALSVLDIQFIGGSSNWKSPSNMAKTGHIYNYGTDQSVTFPSDVAASSFIGNATTATTAEYSNYINYTHTNEINFRSSTRQATCYFNYRHAYDNSTTTSQACSYYFCNYAGSSYASSKLYAGAVYGAVWNDYAEYRNQIESIEPGYCVASANDGKVYKTTEKYQACDGIVSDTFGFAIGKNDDCNTPLAVSGRVLAYCEGNRYDYNSGDTVCAGPDGKVCKMTREEVKEYPDRIVGIVSEIPEYETWGSGNVSVNGRIWIKVK